MRNQDWLFHDKLRREIQKRSKEDKAKILLHDALEQINKLRIEVRKVQNDQKMDQRSVEYQLYSEAVFDLQDGSQLQQVSTPQARAYFIQNDGSFVFLFRSNIDDQSGFCYCVKKSKENQFDIKTLKY
ncbi:unnamed protein product [Bursaphelenchus xylophilus]|uniref:(pine wood nematode) hypothetical protein n=1 Tax=Bursaphelenchus xylophilus TaxID=6326 RepID=A0A811LPF3_BURXY|nr:unnamed protein product [Bursaphelenchus xylophilus]CAG9122823.1 unnamed protein product [Bursaphelenchus xylophilus]